MRARASRTSAGVAGPPPMTTARTDERSVLSNVGSRSMSAICVGTPPSAAILSSATMRSASAAFHGFCDRCWVPPFLRFPASFVVGPRCASAEPAMEWPPPPQASPTSHWVMKPIWRPQNTAPFGVPVVPDVKTMAMGRSCVGSPAGPGARPGGAGPRARRPGSVAGSTSTVVKLPARSAGASSSVVTTTSGLAARSTASRSAGTSLGLTAAVTAPSFAAAT